MNMNFGSWIVVAFILFAGFIATLVTVCVRQDISLVSKDYYKDELVYQDQIQRQSNTAALGEKPIIKVVGQQLQVQFSNLNQIEEGEIKLFCPSNAKMDRTFEIKSSHQDVITYDVGNLKPGMYRTKFLWKMKGKEYYQEEVIYL